MRIILLFLLLVFIPFNIIAQDYYWYKGERITLEKINNKRYIVFDSEKLNERKIKDSLKIDNLHFLRSGSLLSSNSERTSNIKWTIVKSDSFKYARLNRINGVKYETPFYILNGKLEVGLTNLFYVKLKKSEDFSAAMILKTETWPRGVYMIEVTDNNSRYRNTKKLILQ